jgi:hypothetical protein
MQTNTLKRMKKETIICIRFAGICGYKYRLYGWTKIYKPTEPSAINYPI